MPNSQRPYRKGVGGRIRSATPGLPALVAVLVLAATVLPAASALAGGFLGGRITVDEVPERPRAPSTSVLGAACDATGRVATAHAVVAVTLKGGLGYEPNCAVVQSGGSVAIVNVDNEMHNPANDPQPGSANLGKCFDYSADNGGSKLWAGGTYTLAFRIVPGGELQVKRVWADEPWRPCEPTTVRPNGDRVIVFGCTDHWAVARGTVIVRPAALV